MYYILFLFICLTTSYSQIVETISGCTSSCDGVGSNAAFLNLGAITLDPSGSTIYALENLRNIRAIDIATCKC